MCNFALYHSTEYVGKKLSILLFLVPVALIQWSLNLTQGVFNLDMYIYCWSQTEYISHAINIFHVKVLWFANISFHFVGEYKLCRTTKSRTIFWCNHNWIMLISFFCGGVGVWGLGLWGFLRWAPSQRGKTTTGSALDGAVLDFTQILAYPIHNMSGSQLYVGFGHFGWLPSFFGQ